MKGQWLTLDLLIGAVLFTYSLGVATHYIEFLQRTYSSTASFQPETNQLIANYIVSNSTISYLPKNFCIIESTTSGVVFNNLSSCTACDPTIIGRRLTTINFSSTSCGSGCLLEVEGC